MLELFRQNCKDYSNEDIQMKKFLLLLLSLLSLSVLFACGDGGAEGYYTLKGTVLEVGDGYITVLGTEGVERDITYRVSIGSETVYKMDGETVTAAELAEGESVTVGYNGMATRSIPPMINAAEIFIEAEGTTSSDGEGFTMTATVTALSPTYLTVEVTESENAHGTYIVHISESTTMLSKSGDPAAPSDIQVGDSVEIIYGGQTTLSLPPQITAEKIQIK